MNKLEFKEALQDVLGSLEIQVDLSGTLTFNIKDEPSTGPPIDPDPSTGPIDPPDVSVGPPIDPPDVSVGPPIDPQDKTIIWDLDFNNNVIENPYSVENIKNDFHWETYAPTGRTSYVDTNEYVSIEEFDGSKCLKNLYQKDHWGVGTEPTNTEGGTGVNIYSGMTKSGGWEELYLSYSLFFEDGFDWNHGGKLPGFITQPSPHLGRPNPEEGSIAMLMWQGYGKIKWYCYFHEDFDYQYGRGPVIPAVFTTGKWYNITIRLVNSSPWGNDGLCEVFFDGVLNHTWNNIRTSEQTSAQLINAITFNTFQGGGDKSYAPDVTKNMWMDDIQVFYINGDGTPEQPVGKVVSPDGRDITQYLPNWPRPTAPIEPPVEPPVEPPTDPNVNVLFSQDFSESPDTMAYKTNPDVGRDFGEYKWSNGLGYKDHYNVLMEEENGNKRMRVKTRKDQIGPNYGMQFAKILSEEDQKEDVWFSYNVIFKPNFVPVLGGKLPGMTGGDHAGGGVHPSNGFSARMMFKEECSLDFYLYWPEMPGTWGSHFGRWPDPTDLSKQFSFKHTTEVWHNLTTRVKLNTPGVHDGFLEGYIDGICVKRVDNLLLRLDDTVKTDTFNLTHFFGGGSMDWAPPVEQWLKIDDVLLFVSEDDVGKPVPVGTDFTDRLLNWPK